MESQSSRAASPSADQSANFELPTTRAACLTPTPAREAGFTDGGELSSGEARTGPASPPEAVSGVRPTGTPPVDILDQVNLGPNIDRSDQAGSERHVGPEAGNESQPGDLAGDSEPGEPTLGRLIAALIGQALGTGEVSVSFDPEPSPIPCPE